MGHVPKKEPNYPNAQWNPYLYTIHVNHAQYEWTVTRRYNGFLKLHTSLMLSGINPDLGHERPRPNILQRMKSIGLDNEARFPKKPDFLLAQDDSVLVQRQQQLQAYLNSILQCNAYRNHPITVCTHNFDS